MNSNRSVPAACSVPTPAIDTTTDIRNVCLLANDGDGQGSLMRALLAACPSGAARGSASFTAERGEKGTGGVAGMAALRTQCGVTVNLLRTAVEQDDTDITPTLKLVDGALMLMHCLKGSLTPGFKQALKERVQTLVMINKIDIMFDISAEEVYSILNSSVEAAAARRCEIVDWRIQRILIDPVIGTVAFGSGLQGWAFTLPQFAKMYSEKFGLPVEEVARRLWGDHFFNPDTQTWGTESSQGSVRAFCALVWHPIMSIVEASMNLRYDSLFKFLQSVGVALPEEFRIITNPKVLFTSVMKHWLPCERTLLPMFTTFLPTPCQSIQYRFELYSKEIPVRTPMRECNPHGLLILYATRTVKTTDGRRLALGRVFSGTVHAGSRVRCTLAGGVDGEWQSPSHVAVPVGASCEVIKSVSAGGIVGLLGVEVAAKGAIISSKGDVFYVEPQDQSGDDVEVEPPCQLVRRRHKVVPAQIDPSFWSGTKSAFEQYRQLKLAVDSEHLIRCYE